ncbi:MAG TPA: LamG-like jellyroll fold domain-containing protein [Acidimicrobiales bacterium]|nr:LamG-like jellyroll fold domain-containing protein [Acidimicrobiales bacterium]
MRRFFLVAGCVALCLCGAVADSGSVPAAGTSRVVAPKTLKSPGVQAERVQREARRQQRAEDKRLASPKARAAREQSHTAFAQQTDAEALQTVTDEFPEAVKDPKDGGAIGKGDHVVRYLREDHAAIVVSGDEDAKGARKRRKRLVVSTLPLRAENGKGEDSPVSTDIVRTPSNSLKAENPLVDVTVDADLRSGIVFGKAGAGLRPTGIDLGAPTSVKDGRAFWGNVALDTDFLVHMLPDGVETFDVLRSRRSPERLSFDVLVPEGGAVMIDDDFKGLKVTDRDGNDVMRVAPPMAGDADGRLVRSRWVLHGTVAQIEVDHRSADVHYPVIVDPAVSVDQRYWDTNASMSFGGWFFNESNPGALSRLAGTGAWGRGLNIWLPANLTPPAGLWGVYYFKAPGDTFVSRFEAGHLTFYPAGGRSCIAVGILGSWSPLSWNPAQVDVSGYTDASPWGRCAYQQPTGFSNSYQVHSLQGANWNTVTRGNMAAVQWWAPSAQGGSDIDEIFMGGAAVQVTDDRGPVNFGQTGLPSGWTNNPNIGFNTYASDGGLGMKVLGAWYDVDYDDPSGPDPIALMTSPCSVNLVQSALCDGTLNINVSKTGMTDDIHTFNVMGSDVMGNVSDATFSARVDTKAPSMQLANSAYELRGLQVGEASYPLHVDASDHSPNPAAPVYRSGIGSIVLLVDGAVAASTTQGCGQACLDGDSASLSADFTFNTDTYADGAHTLQVRVTDRAGNVTNSDPWTLDVVSGSVTNPRAGLVTPRRATLEAHARRPGLTSVRWEYRTAAVGATPAGTWTTIPVTALRDNSGAQPGSTSQSLTNGDSAPLSWTILSTTGIQNKTQPLEVRGVFSGGAGGTTNPSRITLDTKGLDGRTAVESIGPGSVNLLTGNFALRDTDASIDAGLATLSVTRTYNSRNSATAGPLGPGWSLANAVLDRAASIARIQEPTGTGFVELVLSDGTLVPFSYTGTGLRPAVTYERYALSKANGEYILKDEIDGSTVVLRAPAGVTGTFYPEVYSQAASATAGTAVMETPSGGNTRVKSLYAPAPGGTNCKSSFVAGCRSLEFVYATSTTASGTLPSSWGDYDGRLARIDFKTYDPANNQLSIEAIASYTYDSAGRLRATWDPRISPELKRTYAYDANGLLYTITPPGEQTWTFGYAAQGSDAEPGRLSQVSRTGPQGTATWTVLYSLPTSGTGAPKNMSAANVATWGQADLPYDAAAIFPPDQVPTVPTTDFTRATIHYLNRDGFEVNVAYPGSVGGFSRITTAEHDRYGNVTRELTAANRVVALNAGDTAARSHEVDTQRTFQSDGLELANEIGPLHSVRLDNGTVADARRHATWQYDQTKPAGDTTKYHLATTATLGAQIAGSADADVRVTTSDYNWTVRRVTKRVVDAGSGRLNLTTTLGYDDATGTMRFRRQPNAPSSNDTAGTAQYYIYDPNSGESTCRNNPERYGWPCLKRPAGQPAGSTHPTLPKTSYTYNKLGLLKTESDVAGSSTLRTTTYTYDAAGRELTEAFSGGTGTAVPTATATYDPATGRTASRSTTVSGTTRTIQWGYDSIGRWTSYTDGAGQATTMTYDLNDRVKTTDDGKGTQTTTYDPVTGLPTTLVDSQAGTFSTTYDADGDLATKTLPGGLKATYKADAANQFYDLTWTKTSGCASDCDWLHYGVTRSIRDEQRTVDGTTAQKAYAYDGAGRLSEARNTPADAGCTLSRYWYDTNSNRTSQSKYNPDAGGACNQLAANLQSTLSHSYDAADRLTDAGIAYDALGRVTTLPAADAGGHKLTSSYFVNDRTRSITQSGKTTTYDLDPVRRPMLRTSGGETETSHYAADDDVPSWTSTGSRWSRSVAGLGGDIDAIVDDKSGPVLQLTDLHGDVVATAATSGTVISDSRVLQAKRTGGSWTASPARSLAPGSYVATVRQNDASGNVGSATTHFKVNAVGAPDHAYVDTVSGDEPEAYWRLGEATGTTGADQMTPAHPLTFEGGPTLGQEGVFPTDPDTSVRFDGVDDAATALDQPWRSGGGQFSVETWVKTTQLGGTIMSQGATSDPTWWYARVENAAGSSQGKVRFQGNFGGRIYIGYSAGRIDDGKWHHVAVVAGSSELRVVVDGVSQSGTAATTGPAYAWGFEEGSGTTAKNSGTAGSAGDGTLSGATWTSDGRIGKALNFTSNSRVNVPDQAGLRATTALTVEAWVKPTTVPYPYGSFAGHAGSGGWLNADWALGTYPGGQLMGNVGNTTVYGTGSLSVSTWTHVAMTWSGGTEQVYVNGVLAGTATGVTAPTGSSGSFSIGSVGNGIFNGTIDEVKVYQRALSQTEIASDMTTPAATYDRNKPSAAFGLESTSGTVLADSSYGHDVTMSGTTGWTLGKFGQGLSFNGTNYGYFLDPGMVTPAGMTLSAWLRPSSYNAAGSPFLGQTTFGLVGPASSTSGAGVCAGTTCVRAPTTALNVWTHLTATWDKTTMRLYVNGVLSGSVATTAPAMTGGLVFVGRDQAHGQTAFSNGTVDELRVYPRAQSATEITREYNLPVSQVVGGSDPYISVGRRPSGTSPAEFFNGQLDETAVYPRALSTGELSEHYRTRSLTTTLAAPGVSAPGAGATVADATPSIAGTGLDKDTMADDLRVDVFSGSDGSGTPVQSLLAPRSGGSWNAESAKGLPNGTYTAKVTQSDSSGSYGSATRTFTISGATDPETGYATSVRSDEPAGYWRLGEASGTTAADDRTPAHPGTYSGGPTLGSNGALSMDGDTAPTFDGTDDRVDIPNTAGFWDPGVADFSVEAWVKTSANGDEVIAGKGTDWQLTVSGDSGHLGLARFAYAGGAVVAYSAGRVDDGAWHHVVAVADRDTAARVYVDGAAGTANATPNTGALSGTDGVRIGAGAAGGFFTGRIDEVAIYKSVLSASRIVSHYRLGSQLDASAPAVTVTAPANNAKVGGNVAFSGTAGSAAADAGAVTVTIAPDPNAGPLQTFDYDEFGVPQDTGTVQRYGYLGSKARTTETASGIMVMGQRTYVPTIGRFLQVDPVDGGSANAYDYVNQNAVNSQDLDGTYPGEKWVCVAKICWLIGGGGAGADHPNPHKPDPPKDPAIGTVQGPKRPGKGGDKPKPKPEPEEDPKDSAPDRPKGGNNGNPWPKKKKKSNPVDQLVA